MTDKPPDSGRNRIRTSLAPLLAFALALLAPPCAARADELDDILARLYAVAPADVEGAERTLEALAVRRPSDARVQAGLGLAKAYLGEQSRSAKLIREAVQAGERAVSLNSYLAITYASRGSAYLAAGRYARRKQERVEWLSKAAASFEAAAGRRGEQPWLNAFRRAQVILEERKLGEAIAALRECVKKEPRLPCVRLDLARALVESGDRKSVV